MSVPAAPDQGSDRWPEVTVGRAAAVGAALLIATAAGPYLHWRLGGLAHWLVIGVTAAGAAWVGLARHRASPRDLLIVIALVAVALRLVMLANVPYLSDDIYRYVWDGRVQSAGINPYRYIPAAPELQHLRDAAIYPRINRADYAPTIYPPAAQLFFLLATRFGESERIMRLALVLCEAGAIAATAVMLRRLAMPQARIALFAWHPLAVWEIAGNGHIDAAMVAVLLGGLVVSSAGHRYIAGAIIAAASVIKPTAVLALAVLWRPWDWRLPALAAAVVAAFYAPYLSVGAKVLGFLPGYIAEEELSHGTGFRYLMIAERLLGPMPRLAVAYAAVAALLMMALTLLAAFRSDRSLEATVSAIALLFTAFLILLTPHYPWYYLVLVPFLVLMPWSLTLWLLTVGSLQFYQAIPGEVMPDFVDRQTVFHSLVLVTAVRDLVTARSRGLRSMFPHARSTSA